MCFSEQHDSGASSAKCLSSAESWGSEEGRHYRQKSEQNETSSEDKVDYSMNEQNKDNSNTDTSSLCCESETNSPSILLHSTTIESQVNCSFDFEKKSMDVTENETSCDEKENEGEDDEEKSLQNTIWKISDCSVYAKPTWTSWEERQIYTTTSKVNL